MKDKPRRESKKPKQDRMPATGPEPTKWEAPKPAPIEPRPCPFFGHDKNMVCPYCDGLAE